MLVQMVQVTKDKARQRDNSKFKTEEPGVTLDSGPVKNITGTTGEGETGSVGQMPTRRQHEFPISTLIY